MSKAKKNIGILRHLNNFLPLRTLSQMYKALVRSHLDYCDIIYHMPPIVHQPPLGISLHNLMEKVEKIQYQVALAITGAWKGSNRVQIYEELGWESLSDRRMCNRVLQFHKIVNEKTPSYLREKLPPIRWTLIDLPNVFQNISSRTNRLSRSFFPDSTSICNNVSSNVEIMPSIQKSFEFPHEPYFHYPSHIRFVFQLKLRLSRLKQHEKSQLCRYII